MTAELDDEARDACGEEAVYPAQASVKTLPSQSLLSPPGSFVFAIGRVEPRFPSLGVEKEMAQVRGRADTASLTDQQALSSILSDRNSRYLARQLCWVFTIEGFEHYILVPRDPADLDLLIEAVRPSPRATDVDVVVGVRGPLVPPEACQGLTLPMVGFDQLYSFNVDSFVQAMPRPDAMSEEEFGPAAEELFSRVQQLADNSGAMDEHRAINYVAVRYPTIYQRAAQALAESRSLTAVDVRVSRLSAARKIVDVIFSFTHRQTDVTVKDFVRVDVTEEFPFLVTKLSPFYDR